MADPQLLGMIANPHGMISSPQLEQQRIQTESMKDQEQLRKIQLQDVIEQKQQQQDVKKSYVFNPDGSVNQEETIKNLQHVNPELAIQAQSQMRQQQIQKQQAFDGLMQDMSQQANNIMSRYEQIKSTQGEQAAEATVGPIARQMAGNFKQRAVAMGHPLEEDPSKLDDKQVIQKMQEFQLGYKDYAKQMTERQKQEYEEKKPTSEVGKIEEDYKRGRISKSQRDQAVEKATTWRPMMAGGFGQQGTAQEGTQPKSVLDKPGVTAAVKDYLISGKRPAQAYYGTVMQGVEQTAKLAGVSVDELLASSADVKAQAMSLKVLENRAQNMERAENVLGQEIPVVEDTIKKMNLPSNPILAKAKIAELRIKGDPSITQLDLAAENVFNEFNGIVTGNPGALNVADVQNAKEQYHKAQTPQQMMASMDMMRNMINRAKVANEKSRQEAKDRISSGIGKTSKKETQPEQGGDFSHLWK